jgi:hypothetical protein
VSATSRIGPLGDLLGSALAFANDVVGLAALDDVLDVRQLVTRMDGEGLGIRADVLVLGSTHRERFDTLRIAALADEVERLGLDVERIGNFFDALVDLPEGGLVQSDSFLPSAHLSPLGKSLVPSTSF